MFEDMLRKLHTYQNRNRITNITHHPYNKNNELHGTHLIMQKEIYKGSKKIHYYQSW